MKLPKFILDKDLLFQGANFIFIQKSVVNHCLFYVCNMTLTCNYCAKPIKVLKNSCEHLILQIAKIFCLKGESSHSNLSH